MKNMRIGSALKFSYGISQNISVNDLTRNYFGLPILLSIFAYIKVGNGTIYCLTAPMLENQYIRSCNME